jgi:O-antigen ligase
MSERLAFGYGTTGHGGDAPGPRRGSEARGPVEAPVVAEEPVRERRDWAFTGLMVFTALLFFRPQDQLPFLNGLHLAEMAALAALGAMVSGRLGRGLSVTRITPELVGVVGMGVLILATAPFSVWPGGAVGTFTEMYVKVILIFLLMVNTLTSPKRIEQFTWLIVVATGYIAFRAVFDYARGINLVENGRVQGAVGGMFKNPNDLALNMVAVLPLAAGIALRAGHNVRRLVAAGCGLLMVGAVIASHSRSGSVGLAAMTIILALYLVKRRPGLVFAGALLLALAVPLAPASYWHRLSSITDESQDDTGSREAREILLRESWNAFLSNPITGVGAGQFKNYNPEGRQEAWRESHNVVLQVAAELGIVGLAVFGFLVARALTAGRQVRRLLRQVTDPRRPRMTPLEADGIGAHSAMMRAAMVGWFICALFASVAYGWTFYYLLALAVAPREILVDRLHGVRATRRARGRRAAAVPLEAR